MVDAVEERVVWVQQDRAMWTGRRDGRPLGVVEHGHRYSATGVDGVVRTGYRTLRSAQEALETGDAPEAHEPPPSRVGPLLLLIGVLVAAAAVWIAMRVLTG